MIRPTDGLRRWRLRAITRLAALSATAALGFTVLAFSGCKMQTTQPTATSPKHPIIPPDPTIPPYLRGTINDLTVVRNTGGFPVSSYGLVTGLRGTGDTTAPTVVRDWMLKEMTRHGLGRESLGYSHLSPETMLSDSRVAIVGVVANVPPGGRRGDRVDVIVQAMPGNNTTSLANGMLWRASLRINGMADPTGAVNEYAKAQGNIFVNPAYAINGGAAPGAAMASLRLGTIPYGGMLTTDRPIHLVLRSPSWATSQAIERRIDQAFQSICDVPKKNRPGATGLAEAQDEGYVHLFVPRSYAGDWEHFVGVTTHIFLNADPGFLSLKARTLAEEAVKPKAPLMDISYAFEAIGPTAIPFITPLLSNPREDVQFAAARAAAYLGDRYGEDTLVRIARTNGHEFQVNAVQTLGTLPNNALINTALAELLSNPEANVRIEAYKVLAKHDDPRIFSKVIRSMQNPENEFTLDLIDAKGPPLIYCSRSGRPRVAIFGHKVPVQTPLVFSAFNSRLTISSATDMPAGTKPVLNIFYREEGKRAPVEAPSQPDLAVLVVRLGGGTEDGFHFSYGDVVAILQSMVDKKNVQAAFMLEQMQTPDLREGPDQTRPQGDIAANTGGGETGASLPDMIPTAPSSKQQPPNQKPNPKKQTPTQQGVVPDTNYEPPTVTGPGVSGRPQ